ncbi:MAG: lipid biosynthesis acyltransferase [Deltaproteobacteria bacterium]|nr:lipid biosynthesis acyltransferase [Deltaproteobacteria bacterium]
MRFPPGSRRVKKPWSSRSVGARWQHKFFYALIRIAGRRAAHAAVAFVVLYYVLFRPSARERSRAYLERRFPGRNPVSRLLDCYRLTFELGKVLVDRAALGILGPGEIAAGRGDEEELAKLAGEKRGLILVTAHVGCWQSAMGSLVALKLPVNLLIHREEGDVDLQYFEHGDGPAPYRIIDPADPLGSTLEMLNALKRGEVLCIMGDRAMGGDRSTVALDFLGGVAQFPFTPYRMASAAGAPVAVIFPHRSRDGRYSIRVPEVLRVPENLGRDPGNYLPYARRFVRALEGFVQEHPYQFFNFFDVWR